MLMNAVRLFLSFKCLVETWEAKVAERIWHALPRRIVVSRLKLGDMLCAVPALRALPAAFPEAEIILVGLPWAAEFADRYRGFLGGFRELPGYPGLPERKPEMERVETFLKAMQAEEFDLCIQMHGSGGITNDLTTRFGARRNAGFFEWGKVCPDPSTFFPYPDQGLELRRLLRLLEHLGIPSLGEHLEFPLRDDDIRHARLIRESYGRSRTDTPAFTRVPASLAGEWPPRLFADVASALANYGLRWCSPDRRLNSTSPRGGTGLAFLPIDLAGRQRAGPTGGHAVERPAARVLRHRGLTPGRRAGSAQRRHLYRQ